MEKHWAKFLPESVLGRRLENTYRNLFLRQDPAALAAAYCGTHDLNFAEPEFAGKYLDICAAYHRNRGDGAPMVNFTWVDYMPHATMTEMSFRIWEEFFSKFSRVDGEIKYNPGV